MVLYYEVRLSVIFFLLDFAMQRADEAVREINSSVLGLTGAAGSNSNNSAVHGSGRGGTPGKIT